MQLLSLIDNTSKLYRIIRKSPQPSDKLLSTQLREKSFIGSKERKFISGLLFATLRVETLASNSVIDALEAEGLGVDFFDVPCGREFLLLAAACAILEAGMPPAGFSPSEVYRTISKAPYDFRDIIANALANRFSLHQDISCKFLSLVQDAAKNYVNAAEMAALTPAGDSDNLINAIESAYSLPAFISKAWLGSNYHSRTPADLLALAAASCLPGKPCLRLNKSGLTAETVISRLEEFGIPSAKGLLSPAAIVLERRARINELDLFTSGAVEIQDEGSQIIGYALGPEPGSAVLDACAGAGGKSLQLATIMNDSGKITGSDTEFARLKELKKRAFKAGFKSIDVRVVDQKRPGRKDQFDYVLVDAPCSGIGTLRRDPMKKYRPGQKLLERLSARQLEILSDYASFVRPGGVLLYATCSIMPMENDAVVEKFLDSDSRFNPAPLAEPFDRFGIKGLLQSPDDFKLSLDPGKHGTDGFFMARMTRVD